MRPAVPLLRPAVRSIFSASCVPSLVRTGDAALVRPALLKARPPAPASGGATLRSVHSSSEAAAKTAAEAVAVAQGATRRRAQALMRLLIVGCPGSGKGTLSDRLQKKCGQLSIVTAGDMLRHHIQAGTPLGKQAAEVIERGGTFVFSYPCIVYVPMD